MTTIAAEAVADVVALGESRSSWWDAVRAANAGEVSHLEVLDRAARHDVACEAFRARHFPKALAFFVLCDRAIGQPLAAFVQTASGFEQVYAEEGAR